MSAANIISLVIILASVVITAINIAIIIHYCKELKPVYSIDPELDKEDQQRLDELYKLTKRSAFVVRGLRAIADEISNAAEDYSECVCNLLSKRSLTIIDYNQGVNAGCKIDAVIKKYNLPKEMFTEEEMQNG